MVLVEFANITSYGTIWKGDAVSDAARDDANLVGTNENLAELRLDVQHTVLQDDEEVTVCGVECFVEGHI